MTWPTIFDIKFGEFDAVQLPGQQLAASQANSTLDHLLNLDINAAAASQRLTAIAATIGRSCNDVDTMEKMMEAGMNIAILNMSFGPRDEHVETIKKLRNAAKNFSTTMGKNYPLAIAIRLSGRKIRTGQIADTFGENIELKAGDTVKLTTDETYRERCSANNIYVDFMYLAEQLHKGDFVLLDNEIIELKVEAVTPTVLTCKIERGGILGSYKDVFIPNVHLNMPNYSEADKLDIEMAVHHQVDIIIASFVNSASNVTELRTLLGEKGKKIAIIANIQTIKGYQAFDEILQTANAVMITRQELGSDVTPKKLVIAQKNMVARANQANVPVFISAHLLNSMRTNKIPIRAELLDIANCILDGADGLMLSPETAVGHYPVETVHYLSSTCKEAEACIWTKQVFLDLVDKTPLPSDQIWGTAVAGVLAAQRCIAAAIIVVTSSGKSAQSVAKYRPRCPILAVTRYLPIAKQLHMWRGILPVLYEVAILFLPDPPEAEWSRDLEKRVNFCVKWARERGFIRVGDPIVVISGWRQGAGFTNTMRIIYAETDTNVHMT